MNGEEKNGVTIPSQMFLCTNEITSMVITVLTKNGEGVYRLPVDFTGSVTINLNQGGIAGVERLERIK
jgi:hypothetical protein